MIINVKQKFQSVENYVKKKKNFTEKSTSGMDGIQIILQ